MYITLVIYKNERSMTIMVSKILTTLSIILQLSAGILAFRYSMTSKMKLLWRLLSLSCIIISLYCFSTLHVFDAMVLSDIEIFKGLFLCGGSLLIVLCIVGFGRHIIDPGEYNAAIAQLQSALRDKDVLLKDVHHRIKNNLQVIASILDLNSIEVSGQEYGSLFTDAIAKISTMSIIHSQLYQSGSFDRISMDTHLNEIIFYLKNFYKNGNLHQYEFSIDNGPYITLNQVIPVTLILTELISNILKHAFLPSQTGMISIYFHVDADNNASLLVKDNGSGINFENDDSGTETMGLLLVRNLVQDQLKGSINFLNDCGTEVHITFPFEDVHVFTKSDDC